MGKTAPALLIGFVEGCLIIAAAVFVFGVPMRGNPLILMAGMLVFLLAMIGIGLFLSSLSRTQQQAILGAFTFMAPAVMLSGFATPVDNMPDWLQTVTLTNPLRHFIVVSKGVFLKAMSLDVAWQAIWPMLLIAGCTLLAAGWLFGRKLE
jgi:ABC-2 type transport system permease protein